MAPESRRHSCIARGKVNLLNDYALSPTLTEKQAYTCFMMGSFRALTYILFLLDTILTMFKALVSAQRVPALNLSVTYE